MGSARQGSTFPEGKSKERLSSQRGSQLQEIIDTALKGVEPLRRFPLHPRYPVLLKKMNL